MTQPAALPANEAARLACLTALGVLDSAPEPVFEQITRLASEICGTPISLVSLVDAQRQWFKSNVGLPGVNETHRDLAFCAHALLAGGLLEVPDATRDPRFADNPLVTDGPRIRFYAGAPLTMPHGEVLGTLCVIDQVPRQLSQGQRSALVGLAQVVVTTLMDRRERLLLSHEVEAAEARYRAIVEGQSELISLARTDGTLVYVNPAYAQFFGQQAADMAGRSLLDFVAEHDRGEVAAHLARVSAAAGAVTGVNRMLSADGRHRWVAWTNRCLPAEAGQGRMIHSVGRDITEQREAENALAYNEAHSRMLYQATPAMLHSIDVQGRLLDVSDTWLQRLGYLRDEVMGRPSSDFLTAESARHATLTVLPAFFQTGRCEDVPYQMVRRDGSVIDVLLSAVLERDAQGEAVRSLAVMQDVTERNATSATLNDTTHMLQLVLDSLPARISYWDADNRNRFANKAFLSWYGVAQRDITGRHARDVLGTASFSAIELQIVQGLAGHAQQTELRAWGPDGASRTTDMRFIPDLRNGELHGLFVFALDITAQRQAERDLAERDHSFKLLVEGVRDYAIYMLGPDGRVAMWNAGAERIKGYRAEEVLGRSFSMFFTPEDRDAGRPAQGLAQAGLHGSHESEGWRMRSDGSRFWANALLTAIRDDEGALLGYAKVTRDITEQRSQQAATERALAEKETLLKEVYHRVKNNLQVVQSLLNLQRRTLPAGLARDALEDSVQRVRAMALVHEKLYQADNLAAISLRAYTSELIEQLSEAYSLDRTRVCVEADIADIETGLDSAVPYGLLLTELISNSLKHAFPGGSGGRVSVSLLRRADGDLLTVADDGVGFAGDIDTAGRAASMGLQLADSLARQLGGELSTRSDRSDSGARASALLSRL